jgi:hypothetical protein
MISDVSKMTTQARLRHRLANHQATNGAHACLDALYLSSSIALYETDAFALNERALPETTDPALMAASILLLLGGSIGHHLKWHYFLTWSWPYVRDSLSGVKNGRHAVVNSTALLQQKIAYNRYRLMNKHKHPTEAWEPLKTDSIGIRYAGFAAAFLDGITDGLYLYGCLMVLAHLSVVAFPPTLLIVATIIISVFTVVSLVAKLHHEHLEQQALINSARATEEDMKSAGSAQPISAPWIAVRCIISGLKNANAAITYCIRTTDYLAAKLTVGALYGIFMCIKRFWGAPPKKLSHTPVQQTLTRSQSDGDLLLFLAKNKRATEPSRSLVRAQSANDLKNRAPKVLQEVAYERLKTRTNNNDTLYLSHYDFRF